MNIGLQKATIVDAGEIHSMQICSFRSLLEKYQDFDTNPGNETVDRVIERLSQDFTDFYIIKNGENAVGAIRVVKLHNGDRCRISPIFVIPQFQGRGIAQQVFSEIEQRYRPMNGWELDTILEETGNCHLYEKLGYAKTGRTHKINDRMTLVFYEKH